MDKNHELSIDSVSSMRARGLSWAAIGRAFDISRGKLRSWVSRHQFHITERHVPTNNELVTAVIGYVRDYADFRGLLMLRGHMNTLGWSVSERRLRECLREVDHQRNKESITRFGGPKHLRFPYPLYGPGFCWHADCNLKLGVVSGNVINKLTTYK